MIIIVVISIVIIMIITIDTRLISPSAILSHVRSFHHCSARHDGLNKPYVVGRCRYIGTDDQECLVEGEDVVP